LTHVDGRTPTVSVVVPCYKYGRFLEQCVQSALSQVGVDVRVLIIDDNSPDDSYSVAMRLAELDKRVSVRRHDINRGNIATFNEGLFEWANGDYSVLISADDLLAEGALARATAVMEASPSVGLVYGHAINWIDDRPLPLARTAPSRVRLWKGRDWIRVICRLGHNVITSPEVVVRTSVQQEAGPYRTELPHGADMEMWLRIAARSDIAYIEGVDQAYYRIHGSNMTVSRTHVVDLRERAGVFEHFFASQGAALTGAAEMRREASRRLAKEALWRACRAYDRRHLQEVSVPDLKDFAYRVYADAAALPESWGLRWREWVGPALPPYLQIFMLSAVYRRLRNILWWRHWRKKGY
jgi:hypothetical protein